MATYNNNSYQDPRNINLKGGVKGSGLIRFGQTGAANWGANPYSATEVGIYVNAAGKLMYSYLGTAVDLGQAAGSGFANPMTTAGDIIVGGAAGAAGRLAIGTTGQALVVNGAGTALEWATISAGMTNPMTTAGAVIYGGTAGVATALVVGTAGQVLTVNAGADAVEWTTISVAQSLQAAFNGGPTIDTATTTMTLVTRVETTIPMMEFSSQFATSTGPLIKLGNGGVGGSADILGTGSSWAVTNQGVATFYELSSSTTLKITAGAGRIGTDLTGSSGFIILNPKNAAASALTGTQLDVEINIGGVPYFFTVYPTKA
jgi:hypothetical protein